MADNLELIKKYGSLAKWSKYAIVTVLPHADEIDRKFTQIIADIDV